MTHLKPCPMQVIHLQGKHCFIQIVSGESLEVMDQNQVSVYE